MQDEPGIAEQEIPPGYLIAERYLIERYLGGGGMGNVYLACDRLLNNNQVAIKVLHKEYARDEMVKKRFLREVELMHLVNHKNVVRTFDVGADDDVIFFTMECVKGVPLDRFKRSVSVDYAVLENLIIQICEGLDAIHRAEIVHRDLKPANILVSEDNLVKIADFGVARPSSSNMTQHREIIGSLDYMAPEVWQGLPLSAAVDFYSLGVILFQLVTGSLPYVSSEPATLMWMHCNSEPESLTVLRPDAPTWLDDLVFDLLAKLPEARPSSSKEVIARVQAKSKGEKGKSEAQASFPTFTVNTQTTEKKSLSEVEIPLAAPPDMGEESPDSSESSKSPVKTMRSATSGIIFQENPTSEQIKLHESKVREKMHRKTSDGSTDSSDKKGKKYDPDQKESIRRLERTIYWVLGIALIALLGVSYLLYVNWPQLQEFEQTRSRNSSGAYSGGSTSDTYIFTKHQSGGGEPSAVTSFIASIFSTSAEEVEAIRSKPLSQQKKPSARKVVRTDRSIKPVDYSYDKSSWWSYDNVMAYFFSDSTSASEARNVAVISKVERPDDSAFDIPFYSESRDVEPVRQKTVESSNRSRSSQPQSFPPRQSSSSLRRAMTFSPQAFRSQHPVIGETTSDVRLLTEEELTGIGQVSLDDDLLEAMSEKHALREKQFALSVRLNSVDFSATQRRRELQALKNRGQRTAVAVADANRLLSNERAAYLRWARVARMYQGGKVLEAAEQVGAVSEDVRRKKQQYDAVSLKYRNAVEQNPESSKSLGSELQRLRKDLTESTGKIIDWNLRQELRDMVHLSSLSDMLEQQSNRIEEQKRIFSNAKGEFSDDERAELVVSREEIEADLFELDDTLSARDERMLRRAWALRSLANSK